MLVSLSCQGEDKEKNAKAPKDAFKMFTDESFSSTYMEEMRARVEENSESKSYTKSSKANPASTLTLILTAIVTLKGESRCEEGV